MSHSRQEKFDVPWIIVEARCIVDTRDMARGHENANIYRI